MAITASTSSDFTRSFINNLVENGNFTETDGQDDGSKPNKDGKGGKGAKLGKGGVGAAGGVGSTQGAGAVPGAGSAPGGTGGASDQYEAPGATGKSTNNAVPAGGSLDLGAQTDRTVAPKAPNLGVELDARPPAVNVSEAVPTTPVKADTDPTIADAQSQLAQDMNDPNATQEVLQQDVQNVIDATNTAGRSDETLQIIANAMPANTTQSNMGSIFAMAAQLGVSLDSGKDQIADAAADASMTKTQRAQEVAAQKAAQSAAQQSSAQQAASAANYSANNQRSGSDWNGQTVSDGDTSTTDTSSVGGNQLSYSGPASTFPNDTSKWAQWDDLWAKASSSMAGSDTPAQIAVIKQGIQSEASATGMDPRFILAVVMQESGGNVHVGATNNGVNNPGLMQSHNGASFDGSDASILQMIKDGVEGTASGDGLVQGYQQYKNYFEAARYYNSGQVNTSNLSDGMGATASYASDIANFVMGRS